MRFRPVILEEETPQEVYRTALKYLEENGEKVKVRGKKMKELLNVVMLSYQPGFIDAESVDLDYIYREISNILNRRNCKMEHPGFVKEYLNPGSNVKNLFWGEEVRAGLNEENLQRVIDYLNENPNTRRAVIGLTVNEQFTEPDVGYEVDCSKIDSRDSYYIADYIEDPSEVPCLVFVHFIRRDGKLHMQVQTRSGDIRLGVPYDYYLFQNIHQIVAARTGNKIGEFAYKAISLHKYMEDE